MLVLRDGAAVSCNRAQHPTTWTFHNNISTAVRVTLDVCADFAFSPAAVLELGASMALLEWHRPRCASRAILAAAEWARRGRATVAWPLHGNLCAGMQGWVLKMLTDDDLQYCTSVSNFASRSISLLKLQILTHCLRSSNPLRLHQA